VSKSKIALPKRDDLTPEQINNRRAWVADLRSGEFEQGRKTLYRIVERKGEWKHEFCCLGVADHRFDPTPWKTDPVLSPNGGYTNKNGDGRFAFPDEATNVALGLTDVERQTLAGWNDGTDYGSGVRQNGVPCTFKQIASAIEASYKGK
jgi:hypothetical protein